MRLLAIDTEPEPGVVHANAEAIEIQKTSSITTDTEITKYLFIICAPF